MALKIVSVFCLLALAAAGDYEYNQHFTNKQASAGFASQINNNFQDNRSHELLPPTPTEGDNQLQDSLKNEPNNIPRQQDNIYNNNNRSDNKKQSSSSHIFETHSSLSAETYQADTPKSSDNLQNGYHYNQAKVKVTAPTNKKESSSSHIFATQSTLSAQAYQSETPKNSNNLQKGYHYNQARVNAPAKYDYSYSVNDEITGDIKSHTETRDGNYVRGSYSLIDPDGFKRTVTYTADNIHGFNAIVSRKPYVLRKALSVTKPQPSDDTVVIVKSVEKSKDGQKNLFSPLPDGNNYNSPPAHDNKGPYA